MHKKLLYLFIFLFCTYFIFLSFSRHDNFYSRRLDLGNMDQTVWNVAHGNGFTLTDPEGESQQSRLAIHADFLLILMAPLYFIWSSPKMLLLVQVLIVGLGAIPVYYLALEKLKSEKLSLLLALSYLMYPTIQRNMLHDFHAVALSTSFLLFAYWNMHRNRYFLFTVFGLLAALGKEEIWLVTGLMGLYILLIKKQKMLGFLVSFVSFLVVVLLFWVFIPAVTVEQKHFALTYLVEFGGNLNEILFNLLKDPIKILGLSINYDRLYYYFQLLVPVGFLSLLSPAVLIFATPSLIINSLSNNHLMRMIDYQYTSAVTPFIFISAISGFSVVLTRINKIRSNNKRKCIKYSTVIIFMVIVSLSSFRWGELPYGKTSRYKYFTAKQPEHEAMSKVFNMIDTKFTVSVTNNLGSQLSQREFLYNFPVNAENADYIVVQTGDPYAWPSPVEHKKALDNLLQNRSYQLIIQQGNFYTFKKVSI